MSVTVKVNFHNSVDDSLLKFAVIVAKSDGRWVFCKHKDRDTYEVPGGHREKGENIYETADRELREETGAIDYDLYPVCVYSVTVLDARKVEQTFGMLFYADVRTFETELHSEIEKVFLTEELVTNWTYPLIQPKLISEVLRRGFGC